MSSHSTSRRSRKERPRSPKTRLRTLLGLVIVAVAFVAAAVAISSGKGTAVRRASGGRVAGVSVSVDLLGGIPQRGITLGSPRAPVRLVEFADLQCPYCDEYTVRALPTLIKDYVRTGKLQMQFEDLSFIGPDSVAAGRVAAAAGKQGKLWTSLTSSTSIKVRRTPGMSRRATFAPYSGRCPASTSSKLWPRATSRPRTDL